MHKVRINSRHPSHKGIELPEFSKRVRVRFGSTNPYRRCDVEVNSISAITNTANKIRMKQIFSENDISTPKWLINSGENRNIINDGALGEGTIWFKTPFHSRGRGMEVTEPEDRVTTTKEGYFEEEQVGQREFRVHILDGEAFYIDEKRPRERGQESIIKNMANGYKFRRPLRDYPPEVVTESIKAVKALGLDFGAADVGINDSGVFVYEINTAPSMRSKTRRLYQEALIAFINRKIEEL